MASIRDQAARNFDRLLPRIDRRDHALLRKLCGRRSGRSAESVLQRMLAWPSEHEISARLYHRVLPAPATLDTEDPWVDDDVLAALIKLRLDMPRWEGGWHLRGEIWVGPMSPLVFVGNRAVVPSRGFHPTDEKILQHYLPRRKNKNVMRLKRIVLLRDYWDRNYWHLLHNVLPRLPMADALGVPKDVPVIVSERFHDNYYERLQDADFFKDREIIVQSRKQAIRCEELFLLQPAEFSPQWIRGVAEFIPDCSPNPDMPTRIYCRRGRSAYRGRVMQNDEDVEQVFRSAGFAVVDPMTMSLAEQKALFGRAEIIAGINGAAFANAIFRQGKPLTLAVLISAGLMSTTIPTFAKSFGYRYAGCVVPSEGAHFAAPVTVPLATVHKLLARVLL